MLNTQKKSFNASTWVYAFILIHCLSWTLVPFFTRYNLPLDAIEGTLWGHHLEWGYDKNPYLNGWLTALARVLGGESGWLIYGFSQMAVGACLLAVFQLARRIVGPVAALIAVMMLEGVQYYNFHSIDFNDNTLELGLFGVTIFYFYLAMKSRTNIWYWALTGLFAGLGLMAKYYTLALFAGMFCFMVCNKEQRRAFTTPATYAVLITFLLVTLPHFVWLLSHDFITVRYVFARGSSIPHWSNHFVFPAQFAWEQFETFLPALILYLLFFVRRAKAAATIQVATPSKFDKAFLFHVGLGPFLLTLLLSLATGTYLRAGWGMPLQSLWGIILIVYLRPYITIQRLYAFICAVYILLAALLSAYAISLIHSNTTSSANLPGREIAATITQQWHDTYHTKLSYVAGSRWIGGNISYYSPDHPSVFVEWDHARADWINIDDFKQKGAVFIWDISENETLPPEIAAQFPTLRDQKIMTFEWKRNDHHLEPIKLGVAILPPAASE